MVPGIKVKLFRGQHRPEATAMGTIRALVAMASGAYKTGAARLSIATSASIVPIAVSSGRCWPRKSFRFIPGTIAVSIGPPISPRVGESSADLMERVSNWIESEMRRIDPDAYPASERPPDLKREEAALSQALEAQAAAARAAQGGIAEDSR